MSKPSQQQAISALLTQLPSIQDSWNNHLDDWEGEDAGDYNDMSVIIHHIVDKYPSYESANHKVDTSEFSSFFAKVEELLLIGDEAINELITIGLFEGIQNVTASDSKQWTRFETWLGDYSKKAWNDVIMFWNPDAEQDAAVRPATALLLRSFYTIKPSITSSMLALP